MRNRGPKPAAREAVMAAIALCQDELGATYHWLVDNTPSVHPETLRSTLYKLVKESLVFSVPHFKVSRYFLTAEARDAAQPAVLAHLAKMTADNRAAYLEGQRRRDRARTERRKQKRIEMRKLQPPKPPKEKPPRPPKPAKPPKAAKPKPAKPSQDNACQPAPVSVKAQKHPKWSDMPAIKPPGLKVQRVSGCPSRTRYEPEPGFRGEFGREWKALRGNTGRTTT